MDGFWGVVFFETKVTRKTQISCVSNLAVDSCWLAFTKHWGCCGWLRNPASVGSFYIPFFTGFQPSFWWLIGFRNHPHENLPFAWIGMLTKPSPGEWEWVNKNIPGEWRVELWKWTTKTMWVHQNGWFLSWKTLLKWMMTGGTPMT